MEPKKLGRDEGSFEGTRVVGLAVGSCVTEGGAEPRNEGAAEAMLDGAVEGAVEGAIDRSFEGATLESVVGPMETDGGCEPVKVGSKETSGVGTGVVGALDGTLDGCWEGLGVDGDADAVSGVGLRVSVTTGLGVAGTTRGVGAGVGCLVGAGVAATTGLVVGSGVA